MAEVVSFRELARRIGVSDMAVRKADKAGRFPKSVATVDGKRVVVDAALALQEWAAGTHRVRILNPSSKPVADGSRTKTDTGSQPVQQELGEVVPLETLIDAQIRATQERARKLKLENDVEEGRLVSVEKVSKERFESGRTIREALLNLPARLSGELAAEADASVVYIRLDAAVREALTAASDSLLAMVNE